MNDKDREVLALHYAAISSAALVRKNRRNDKKITAERKDIEKQLGMTTSEVIKLAMKALQNKQAFLTD